jgi:anthranilate/para-aminobenzoate synthase component I
MAIQVVLSQRHFVTTEPFEHGARSINPPYMFYLDLKDFQIIGT